MAKSNQEWSDKEVGRMLESTVEAHAARRGELIAEFHEFAPEAPRKWLEEFENVVLELFTWRQTLQQCNQEAPEG